MPGPGKPFQKGWKGGPGRPSREHRPPTVIYDLKHAARLYAAESLETIVELMRNSDDVRVKLMAAVTIIERGYGKAEQKSEQTTTHKFAVVPAVMDRAEWLARHGQPKEEPLPKLPPPDIDLKPN
jgi:hypothetical protein